MEDKDNSMNSSAILARLAGLSATVNQICNTSGVPGASVGILHNGEVIYTDNFGYRNLETDTTPTKDTVYGIGSLTKSFVAAGLTSLLDKDDNIGLDTPIEKIFPSIQLQDSRTSSIVTIADLLSHRSGLYGDMSTSLQGDLEMLLEPKDLIPAVNDLECPFALRSDWAYNNWGYSIGGAIMEKITQKSFHQALKESVLSPLGLENTTTHPKFHDDADLAIAYSALSDGTFHPHPYRSAFEDSIFEAAGGIYSTVGDMMSYANAVLKSEKSPVLGPLQYAPLLLSNQIPLDNPSRDYRFYGLGWIRTQLPGIVGRQGENAQLFELTELPVLGAGSPTQMVYYHQGAGIGYTSAMLLFPETRSAIVVLTNSFAFGDIPDWVSQAYAAALFDFPSPANYLDLAKEGHRRKLANYDKFLANLESRRNPDRQPTLPLEKYAGSYYNTAGNFFIQVRSEPDETDMLAIAFQGKDSQVYKLRHLHDNTFEWALSYDDAGRRERYIDWDPEYFLIEFHDGENSRPKYLTWARIPDVRPSGMPLYHNLDKDNQTANVGEERPSPRAEL